MKSMLYHNPSTVTEITGCRPKPRANVAVRLRLMKALAFVLVLLACAQTQNVCAHPLGNFTVNHFTRIEIGAQGLRVRYVIDMAEIPTFQESQKIDVNGDGALSTDELKKYVEGAAGVYADGLSIEVDGARVPLRVAASNASTPQGAGGLQTLRAEFDFAGDVSAGAQADASHRMRFEDKNFEARVGWRETVVVSSGGVQIFDSTAFGSAVTNEIKAYPQDMLTAPLDERTAELSWTTGAIPQGAVALRTRDGRPAEQSRDSFAELIAVRELTFPVALLGLLIAAGLGAMHAFSPGHGKTVVGAYLVGSRGTAKHAAFLGLTVTVTHTAGVFALGLVTLFASQYIVPERLYPVLGVVSGAIVLVIGLSLFVKRLRASLGVSSRHHHTHEEGSHSHAHDHAHSHGREHSREHEHGGAHSHGHAHDEMHAHGHVHSHGGRAHSHLPPGADGSPVTWRSLLALGISGGLLPCPSALVVLLSAINFHRVGYGLALVFAFSVGLAATLTAVGLAFVYASRFVKRPTGNSRLVRLLPVASALVIACVGAALCYEALAQAGVNLHALVAGAFSGGGEGGSSLASTGALTVLGLGLVFGLKHATETDHVIAVSTIVSEHRSILRAGLVGGLWGAGHTASLVFVGVIVLLLRVAIPERVADWLEFGVALMIIALGVNALTRTLRGRAHVHAHSHGDSPHVHVHFHDTETAHDDAASHVADDRTHSHAVTRVGLKPLLVGAMHGLAGSAALTLLVLTQIKSVWLGLLYLLVFGAGSIVGMLLMSGLVGLPFALAARRVTRFSHGLQALAGALSIAFGLWYAYHTGIASGLLL